MKTPSLNLTARALLLGLLFSLGSLRPASAQSNCCLTFPDYPGNAATFVLAAPWALSGDYTPGHNSAYFAVDVTTGNAQVPAGAYLAWCADAETDIDPGPLAYNTLLYSTCNPDLNQFLPTNRPASVYVTPEVWHQVNYLLNHKQGQYFWDVQIAIWSLVGGPAPADYFTGYPYPDANIKAIDQMVADAQTNAAAWQLPCGGTIAVIAEVQDWATPVQLVILEVPCTTCGTTHDGPPCLTVTKEIACLQPGDTAGPFSHLAQGFSGLENPGFLYRITVANCGAVPLKGLTVLDDQLGDLSTNFLSAPTAALAPGDTVTRYYKMAWATNATNTVTVSAQSATDGATATVTDSAVALVTPAAISCGVRLSSPCDLDGNTNDNHVSLSTYGTGCPVTFDLQICNPGPADLTAVTLNAPALAALTCGLPAPFDLPAGACTNFQCTTTLNCPAEPVTITLTVTAQVASDATHCAYDLTSTNRVTVASTCDGRIECATGTGSLCGAVLLDCNADGKLAGDAGLAGVLVTLQAANGYTVGATLTDTNGAYCFSSLLPGNFTVVVTPPANMVETVDPDGVLDHRTVVTLAAAQTVTGVDFGYTGSAPAVSLLKTGPATAHCGDTITYTFAVTNTGNTCFPLGLSVSDPLFGGEIFRAPSVAPGQGFVFTTNYVIQPTDPANLVNTATATGQPPAGDPVSATATWTVQVTPCNSGLTLTKRANPITYTGAGQIITYTYVLQNTGNMTLTGPFSVTDDKLGTIECNAVTSLAPGETTTATATYVIQPGDLGTVTNLPTGVVAIINTGNWLQGVMSSQDTTVSDAAPGIPDGLYPAWCIQDYIPNDLHNQPATLYSTIGGSLPADVAALPWGKVNYVLNHKIRGAGATDLEFFKDVQTAIWVVLGEPNPEFGISATAQQMINEANANAGFVPGNRDVVAVIIYSDGMSSDPNSIQESILEMTRLQTITNHATATGYAGSAALQSNEAQATVAQVLSSPVAPPVDTLAWGHQPSAKATVTTSAFSTASPAELLLAFVSADNPSGANTTVTSVSGAGLTWQLVKRTNVQKGTAEIWRAFASAKLNNVTVRATLSKAAAASITVIGCTGVDTTGVNGAGAIGAVGSANGSSGAPSVQLATTRNNSWVFAVGTDWDNPIPRTLGPNQTLIHQYMPPVGDTYWVQRVNDSVAVSGTVVTLNDTAPTSDRWNFTAVEILPPAGPPQLVTVPNVVNQTQASAASALTAAGLTVGTVTAATSPDVPAGSVISQDPAAGTQFAAGGAVALVVSSGPPTSAIAVDKVVYSDGNGTQTTPAFSTTMAGELLLAFAASDGPTSGGQKLTLSGAGLTWTRIQRANNQLGVSEIWQATAPSQLTGATVKSTPSISGYHQSLTVVAFTGASGIGASAKASAASGAPRASLTTTKSDSIVFGVGNDWDSATARTLGVNQTLVHQFMDASTGDTYWVQSTASAGANAGTVVTLNCTAPTSDRWNFAIVEIVK